MKKYIIAIAVGLLFTATPVMAQEVPATTTPAYISNHDLLVQLISMYQQLLQLLLNQQASLNTITVNTTPMTIQEPLNVPQEPIVDVSTPEVIKAISIEIGEKQGSPAFYNVYAFYTENGVKIVDVPLTISSDDNGQWFNNGHIDVQTSTQTTHGNVGVFGQGGVGSSFSFVPEAQGDRVITATANGVTATTTAPGQN